MSEVPATERPRKDLLDIFPRFARYLALLVMEIPIACHDAVNQCRPAPHHAFSIPIAIEVALMIQLLVLPYRPGITVIALFPEPRIPIFGTLRTAHQLVKHDLNLGVRWRSMECITDNVRNLSSCSLTGGSLADVLRCHSGQTRGHLVVYVISHERSA